MFTKFEEKKCVLVKGPEEDDDGCEHPDHSEDSDADSPDTDAGR